MGDEEEIKKQMMLQQSSVEVTFDAKEQRAKQVNIKVYDESAAVAASAAVEVLEQTVKYLKQKGFIPKE